MAERWSKTCQCLAWLQTVLATIHLHLPLVPPYPSPPNTLRSLGSAGPRLVVAPSTLSFDHAASRPKEAPSTSIPPGPLGGDWSTTLSLSSIIMLSTAFQLHEVPLIHLVHKLDIDLHRATASWAAVGSSQQELSKCLMR